MPSDSGDQPHNYIFTHSGRLQLHGPFENFRQLTAYGLWWSENSGDGSGCDPCWQSVYVEDPSKPLEIITPSAELWHGDSYATYSYAEYGTFSPRRSRS